VRPWNRSGSRANAGTLFAFAAVSIGVMVLRITDKTRVRPFKTPLLFVVAPLSVIGCVVLFMALNNESKILFAVWAVIGLVFYFLFGFWNSNIRKGVVDVVDLEDHGSGEPPA
jgi:APA family basic amino acid/polyamine antiporter